MTPEEFRMRAAIVLMAKYSDPQSSTDIMARMAVREAWELWRQFIEAEQCNALEVERNRRAIAGLGDE